MQHAKKMNVGASQVERELLLALVDRERHNTRQGAGEMHNITKYNLLISMQSPKSARSRPVTDAACKEDVCRGCKSSGEGTSAGTRGQGKAQHTAGCK